MTNLSFDGMPDGVELIIIIIGTFAQAISGQGDAVSIIGALVIWRFFVSLGLRFPYTMS